MYDVIHGILDHVWQTGTNYNSTEQQTIYYICGAVLIIGFICLIDVLYRVFRHFWR